MNSRPGSLREASYVPKLAGVDDLGSSLITLTVDVSRYRRNLREILDLISPARLICVVKANAYGFGVAGLVPVLAEFPDVSLGVATADEALELKALGYPGRIILLGYTHPKCYYQIIHSGCQLSAYRPENIPELAEACRELDHPLELHIKVDTGMTRMGVPLEDLAGFVRELRRYPQMAVVGLFSHLVDSAAPEREINALQEQRFLKAIEIVSQELGYRPECHLANTAAVLNQPRLHLDSVRVGIATFGIAGEAHHEARMQLEPCFRLASEVIDIHHVKPGDGVSYCHTWTAGRATMIVTLPYGYADGLPRSLSNKAAVLIRGRRCPLVGNVTMDYVMADVGGADGAGGGDIALGDEAVFIGEQQGPGGIERITIEEVSGLAGTIPYEVSCAWGRRVRRVYFE
jgi:alanine racemase